MQTLRVSVWRGAEQGAFQSFEVPRHASQTVLDVITHIQRHIDASLAYRFACRVGMCGSCAMTVNGVARWTCRTHVDAVADDGALEVAPLGHLPVIRDLVTDMAPFFDKWARARGQFSGSRTRHEDFARISPEDAVRRQADAGIERFSRHAQALEPGQQVAKTCGAGEGDQRAHAERELDQHRRRHQPAAPHPGAGKRPQVRIPDRVEGGQAGDKR